MVPCGQVAVYPVVKGLACVHVQVDLDNIFSEASLFLTLAMLLQMKLYTCVQHCMVPLP